MDLDLDFVAVLEDTAYANIATRDVYAIRIPSKRDISKTVLQINARWPMNSKTRFLKRVKISAPPNDDDVAAAIAFIDEPDQDEILQLFPQHQVIKVQIPIGPIRTKVQSLEASKFWPVNFHPDNKLEMIVNQTDPEIWNDNNFARHAKFIKKITDSEKDAASAVAIVVNPNDNCELVIGSNDSTHPLKHAVIDAIDKLSELSDERKTYLGTGFDIYLSHEPCAMCAMALVHMRIKRIFFKRENLNQGALKSKFKLHTLTGINHTFQVYQAIHRKISNNVPKKMH